MILMKVCYLTGNFIMNLHLQGVIVTSLLWLYTLLVVGQSAAHPPPPHAHTHTPLTV